MGNEVYTRVGPINSVGIFAAGGAFVPTQEKKKKKFYLFLGLLWKPLYSTF